MAIQQKLHTKLVQKLILTPSLQQAIKLLPMSTLELADLLNQEMVENPLLEEVPTEELQPAEQQQAAEKPRRAAGRRKRRRLGRRRLRVLLRRLPRRRLPVAHAVGSQGAAADREHALDGGLARPTTSSGNSPSRPTTNGSRKSAAPSSATSTTTATWWRRSRRLPRWGSGRSPTSSARSSTSRRSIPIGVAARDLQECLWLQMRHLGSRRHADGKDRHRAPAPAAEPPGAGDRAQARHVDRGSQGARRDHPQPRSEARQPLQPVAVAVRHPRRLRRQGRGSVRRGAERGRAAAAADQPGLPTAAGQDRRGGASQANRTTRRAPTSRTSSGRRCG